MVPGGAPLTLDAANLEFSSVSVQATATLVVSSGTVIRVLGSFTCGGLVNVGGGAGGGKILGSSLDAGGFPAIRPADPGLSIEAATVGDIGDATARRSGGAGGTALVARQARLLTRVGSRAGGGGGGGLNRAGGLGGGSLTIVARDAITLGPGCSIQANGGVGSTAGSGGGAGGLVVLASNGPIAVAGPVHANGGKGGLSNGVVGSGGGGGGGVIRLISPAIDTSGATFEVEGGAQGGSSGGATVAVAVRAGGAGGGGFGGNGGSGGAIETDGTKAAATAGAPGFVLQDAVSAAIALR